MYKLNTNQVPSIFNDLIKKPEHKYPTKFSKICFSLKASSLKTTKYAISYRGPKIWNDFLTKSEKELPSLSVFKKKLSTPNCFKMNMSLIFSNFLKRLVLY